MDWFLYIQRIYGFVRPALDVAILAILIYKGYTLFLKTQAIQIVKGAGFLALLYGAAFFFRLTTLQWILNILAPVLFVAIAIAFQPELRRIIINLGRGQFFQPDSRPRIGQLDAVITAAELLSQQRRGALVVFPRRVSIRNIIEAGTRLNADISSQLIVTIFEFDTPLHDGAIIIQNNRIVSAGCFLPASDQQDIKKNFGTRHRAALGMSEQSDAVILIVSEETGAISLAYDSKLYYDLSSIEIARKLGEILNRDTRRGPADQSAGTSSGVEDDKESISDLEDVSLDTSP